MNNVIKAIHYVTSAHEHQKRKGKEVSYIMQSLSVGLFLASSGAKEEVIIAGILHDTMVTRNNVDLTKHFQHVYRVLMSRAHRGVYVHFMDKTTEDYFRANLGEII